MKLYMSDYIFTGKELLKDVAVVLEDNIVLDVGGYKALLKSYPEAKKIELYGGVLFPGFVNTHVHIESGYLKGKNPKRKGFVEWLKTIMSKKIGELENGIIINSIKNGIEELRKSGVAIVGDISNTLLSVGFLESSMPDSVVFYENYSLKKERACEVKKSLESFRVFDDMVSLTPHSIYSSHPCLMEYLCKRSSLMSIHFLESYGEPDFFQRKGELFDFLDSLGLVDDAMVYKNHWDFLKRCGCLKEGTIFVHCVYAKKEDLERIKQLDGTVCLCLRSNDYITGELPNVYEILESVVNVAIGTDSLASNVDLNFIEELRFIKKGFPLIDAQTIFGWSILGGARALKVKWGFFKGYEAQPVFISSRIFNPLESILEEGGKPLEVVIS